MNGKRLCLVGVLCAVLLGFVGCDGGKSDSASSSSASPAAGSAGAGAGAVDKQEQEASDFVMAEINKRWIKSPDGWISAFNSGNQFAPNYLRQLREISITGVWPEQLTDTDKLNGIQWAGDVNFRKTPSREAGDVGPVTADGGMGVNRTKGRWSQWVDLSPEKIAARKVNGAWHVGQDTMLLNGTRPTPTDYATAGIKP